MLFDYRYCQQLIQRVASTVVPAKLLALSVMSTSVAVWSSVLSKYPAKFTVPPSSRAKVFPDKLKAWSSVLPTANSFKVHLQPLLFGHQYYLVVNLLYQHQQYFLKMRFDYRYCRTSSTVVPVILLKRLLL